jgi:hypothetical protein
MQTDYFSDQQTKNNLRGSDKRNSTNPADNKEFILRYSKLSLKEKVGAGSFGEVYRFVSVLPCLPFGTGIDNTNL